MAAGFKKVHFFHGQPVFTRQQHKQPGALWGRHPLLPLQEAAFDLSKAESKGKERDVQRKPLAWLQFTKVSLYTSSKLGAFHVKLLGPRILVVLIDSESPHTPPKLRHPYRTDISLLWGFQPLNDVYSK